ncbi:hypothetical protein LB553_26775 [Mesorhizobium sp. CA8]|uniref:hypothetical protein n=1 Tax=unclassified Mesorhizobium TaxID=325217 RepID=UPI001CCAF56B|nr:MULTISPECIES: hypothetical protein [unclassified Mesorhizobium]MBZ9764448.1 hypothetical protein [Mesorhizobium sp. CA8]MBZ9821473.1 hypothetical protein [Mesorhizobium sp. CA4]
MNDKANPPKKGDGARKDRLAEALRANLQKRKAQTRSRRAGDADKQRARDADKQRARDADQRSEGLPAAGKMHKD